MTTDPITQSQFNKNRKDKFLLVLDLPPLLKPINNTNPGVRSNVLINENSLQFSVYGSVLPTISVPEVEAPFAGGTYKLSSNSRPPYDNITVNFTVDNRFNNYWVIYKWLNLLSSSKNIVYNEEDILPSQPNNVKLPLPLQPRSYQTDLTIYGKDEFDNNVIKFTYTKAFPVSLQSIDYNYRDSDEIESSFTFAFSQFFAELV
jgi:hypothetical protein